VSLDPAKSIFSTDYISAPRGCWRLKFSHELDIHQGLLAHTTGRRLGVPQKNFKGEQTKQLKLGFKINKRVL